MRLAPVAVPAKPHRLPGRPGLGQLHGAGRAAAGVEADRLRAPGRRRRASRRTAPWRRARRRCSGSTARRGGPSSPRHAVAAAELRQAARPGPGQAQGGGDDGADHAARSPSLLTQPNSTQADEEKRDHRQKSQLVRLRDPGEQRDQSRREEGRRLAGQREQAERLGRCSGSAWRTIMRARRGIERAAGAADGRAADVEDDVRQDASLRPAAGRTGSAATCRR